VAARTVQDPCRVTLNAGPEYLEFFKCKAGKFHKVMINCWRLKVETCILSLCPWQSKYLVHVIF